MHTRDLITASFWISFLSRLGAFCLGDTFLVLLVSSLILPTHAATSTGYHDFSYGGPSVSAPTGQKPQSKVWFNDGIWWGSLFNQASDNYEIYRLNTTTQSWSTTGVVIDSRNGASADVLWDGTKLYVVTAGTDAADSTQSARVLVYSYSAASQTYTVDQGFPVTLATAGGMETIVIAKDTANMLWVAYTKNSKVYVAHSTTTPASWTAPYLLTVTGSNNLTPDDIASVIAYGNNIGVMWSNQNDAVMYFASHMTGTIDTSWTTAKAVSGASMADDHINLKTDRQGNVYAVTKTSRTDVSSGATEPVIVLAVRSISGVWKNYTVAQANEGLVTRGIAAIDESSNILYVFYTDNENGGSIVYKQTPLNAISFSLTAGTPFIKNTTDLHINNATDAKQNSTAASGLLVLAGDDTTQMYDHNYLVGSAPTSTPAPTVVPTGTIIPTPVPTLSLTPTPTSVAGNIFVVGTPTTSTNGTGATSVTLTKPTGVNAGDLLVTQIVVRTATTTITPPSGWSLIRRDNTSSAMSTALYKKVAGASEPASSTFTFTTIQEAVGSMSAYRGVNTISPIDAQNAQYNDTIATMTGPSLTTTVANDRLLWFGAVTVYNTTISVPSGMTKAYGVNNGAATGISGILADQTVVTAGATGIRTGSNSAGKSNITQVVALKPAQ